MDTPNPAPPAGMVSLKTRAFYQAQIDYLGQFIETTKPTPDGTGTEKKFDPGLMAMLLMMELLLDNRDMMLQLAAKPDHCHLCDPAASFGRRSAVSTRHPLLP